MSLTMRWQYKGNSVVKVFYLGILGLLMLSLITCTKKPEPLVATTPLPINGQLALCGREENAERFDIYLVDLETRQWRNLTEKYVFQIDDAFGHSIGCDDNMHPYRVTGLAWSPGGDLIMVDAGGPYLSVPYIMDVSQKGDVDEIVQQWPGRWTGSQIFLYPHAFSWSADGDSVAFVGMTASDGYSNLFVGDVTDWEDSNPDTPVVQMTYEYRDFPGVIYAPSWSSDGKKVAVSFNGHASGIAILSSDGAQADYVTDDTSDMISHVENPSPWDDYPAWKPSWFPDGSSIVFVGARTPDDRTTLFKVDENGQNLTVLVPKGVRNPVVSPDGQFIAYIEYAAIHELRTIGSIVRVGKDGTNRQVGSLGITVVRPYMGVARRINGNLADPGKFVETDEPG
jgi:hypothetical protein